MSGLRHLTPTSNTFSFQNSPPSHSSCSLPPLWRSRWISRHWKCPSLAKEFILGKLFHYSAPRNWLGTPFDQICYICLLSNTPLLSSNISDFVLSKQKLVILTDMQDPNLTTTCWYFFINILTGHQKSVQGCFPLLESNLDLWDENRCFTNGLLKCLVPRATKEFTWSYMYKSIHISPPFQPYSHLHNYYRRVIQMTRL